MRTVFNSTNEVCHIFAQRVQTEGRAGNIFFEGNVIYSYGYHYELARFFQGANNETAILINDTGCSVSTAKHIGCIRSATSHFTQFNFTETDGQPVLYELESLAKKMIKARKPEIYINQANNLLDSYIEYCNFVGKEHEIHGLILKAHEVFSTGKVNEYFESKKSELKKIEREKIKREKLQLKKDIKDFLNHKVNFVSCKQNNESFVRLSKDGERVETSKGVKVDAKDAKKLYQLIKAGKDIKGYKIDYYTVISLNGTLKIGCHDINVKNMHQVGEKLLQM